MEVKEKKPPQSRSVYLPIQLWALVKLQANREGRSLSNWIRRALEEKLHEAGRARSKGQQ